MGKTVVIIDHAHCGTTMLAGLLEIAGIPMVGDNYKETKWEDLDIIATLKPGSEKAFAWLVRERNRAHEVWGFKYAGCWKFMDVMLRHLREPVFLAIYKDPVSVTTRRFGSRAVFMGKLKNTLQQFSDGIDGILATRQPVHVLSYHRAVVAPRIFIEEVMDIVGIEANTDNLAKFIQPNREGGRTPYPLVTKSLRVRYEERS